MIQAVCIGWAVVCALLVVSPAWMLSVEQQAEVPAVAWIGVAFLHLLNVVIARRAGASFGRPSSAIGQSILLLIGGLLGVLTLAGLARMGWTFWSARPVVHLDAVAGALWQLALPGLILGYCAGLSGAPPRGG